MSADPPAPEPRSRVASDRGDGGLDYPSWVPWLTLAIVVAFAVFGSLPHHGEGAHPAALALIWVSIVPWLLDAVGFALPRWMFGVLVLVPQAILHVGGDALGIADLTDEGPTHIAIMIVVFAAGQVGATAPWRVAAPVAVAAAAIIAGRGVVEPQWDAGVFWGGGALMALAIGYMMRRQAETTFQLRAAHEALAREAVLQERHRIAREVHDVIAHSLTVTMMHLTAARMAVQRDPEEATSILEDAEGLGRQSLTDIRRTVGLLRDESSVAVEPPQPDAHDLDRLLTEYRAAGMDISAELDADLSELPPSAGLAVYRIVQESITNAGKHAPGAAVHVSLRRDDGMVDLRIRNGAGERGAGEDSAGAGMGIVGMRERAALLGGTLRAGADGEGWRVHCRFPLHGADPRDALGSAREEAAR